MGSRLRTIVTEVRDQIAAAVVGSGDYDHDLRDTDSTERVYIGWEFPPLVYPAAMVYPVGRPSTESGNVNLDSYSRTLSVVILGFVQATTADRSEVLLRACDLADDIEQALETDVSLGGNALGLSVSYGVLSGAEYNLPINTGMVEMSIDIRYHETRGSV